MLFLKNNKKIIMLVVFVPLLAVTFFGFTTMMYGTDGRMASDCPLSFIGVSLCSDNTAGAAISHISAYNSFFSVFISSNFEIMIFVFLSIFALLVSLVFNESLFRPNPQKFITGVGSFIPPNTKSVKISHWLSLFENSPSFI